MNVTPLSPEETSPAQFRRQAILDRMSATDKAISSFAKSLRECNRAPVLAGEEIIEIRRFAGQDGRERELIIVKELVSELPEPGCRNTTSTFPLYSGSILSLTNSLWKGYGVGRGIVTDRVTFRYVA